MAHSFRAAMSDETIGALVTRLADDGKAYASAQLNAYKQEASSRFAAMRTGLVLFVIAFLLVIGAVVTLLVGFALALAPLVGAAGAGAIVAVGALVVAGLLGWIGAKSLSGGAS